MDFTSALLDYLLKLIDGFGFAITTVGGIFILVLIAYGLRQAYLDWTGR